MLTPEEKQLHVARHKALIESLKSRWPNAEHSEGLWERTLGELSAGQYDSILGLRMFIAETLATIERQDFIDKTAIRLCQIARNTTSKTELEGFARVAYDQAEAMWRERQCRRNVKAELPL
jgi:hypothetical protein